MDILIRDTCPTCKGSKHIINPLWKEYEEDANRGAALDWFIINYQLTSLPPYNIHCLECSGTGNTEKWMPLPSFANQLKQNL